MTDRELAQRLKEAAYRQGEFTLRSGRKSSYYLDKYQFETRPVLLRELGRRLARYVSPRTQRIAGAELGAVALAAATSLETGLPFIIVRNARKADYGTGNLIEGELNPGDRVLLVEDIVTSGGQVLQAARAIRDAGALVEMIVAVVDRQEGGREAIDAAGLRFAALFTAADLGISPDGGASHP